MESNINSYRAPMVTAICIILGFVLAFMGKWATEPTGTHQSDWLVVVGFLTGIVLLTAALYRILNNRIAREQEENYYHRTLRLFMLGIICSFAGTLPAVVQQIWF